MDVVRPPALTNDQSEVDPGRTSHCCLSWGVKSMRVKN